MFSRTGSPLHLPSRPLLLSPIGRSLPSLSGEDSYFFFVKCERMGFFFLEKKWISTNSGLRFSPLANRKDLAFYCQVRTNDFFLSHVYVYKYLH